MDGLIFWLFGFGVDLFMLALALGFALFAGFCFLIALSFIVVPILALFIGEDNKKDK